MGDQRVDQRAGPVAGGGMDHQPARLVDDDDRIVLVDDIERDRLRLRLGVLGRRQIERDRVAGVDVVAGIADRAAVDGDPSVEDERLVARAREFGDVGGEHAVEPLAGLGGRDLKFLAAISHLAQVQHLS